MQKLVPYEFRKDGFIVHVQLDPDPCLGVGPKHIIATAIHENCMEVVLGQAWSDQQILSVRPTEAHPIGLILYHSDKSPFDRGIEQISEEEAPVRLEK